MWRRTCLSSRVAPPVVALTAAQLRSSQRGARKPKQQAIGQTVDLPSQGRLCTTPAVPCIVVGDGRHSVVHSDASSELDTASIAVSAIGDSGAYDCLLSMTSGECSAIPEVPGTRCSPIGVQTSKPRRASRAVQTDAADFCSLGTVQGGGVITHNMKDALTALGCAQDAVDSTASELKALTGELDLARQALARHSVAAAEAHTRMVSGPFGQLSPELVVERMSVLVEMGNTLHQSASLRPSLLELEAQAKLNHEAHECDAALVAVGKRVGGMEQLHHGLRSQLTCTEGARDQAESALLALARVERRASSSAVVRSARFVAGPVEAITPHSRVARTCGIVTRRAHCGSASVGTVVPPPRLEACSHAQAPVGGAPGSATADAPPVLVGGAPGCASAAAPAHTPRSRVARTCGQADMARTTQAPTEPASTDGRQAGEQPLQAQPAVRKLASARQRDRGSVLTPAVRRSYAALRRDAAAHDGDATCSSSLVLP